MLMKKYFLLILFVFLIPQTAHLQTNIEEQISIDFSNEFPRPNEVISVYIESYQSDLNKSNISWYLDGVLIDQGVGLKDFSFNAGGLGEESILEIVITRPSGSVLKKTYYISPGEVDLYYEGETYIPPFYGGRPEFSLQSNMKLVALPNLVDQNGQKIPSNLISYTWKIDGEIDQRNSGTGKDVYYYVPKIIPRPIDVTLEVTPIKTSQSAKISTTIYPTESSISVYEKNPIYGTVFEQTIKNDFILTRNEVEVEVVPYGFSLDIFNNGVFDWRINEKNIDNFKSNTVVFRKVEEGESKNNVSVEVIHNKNILQYTRKSFNLNFGNTNENFNF